MSTSKIMLGLLGGVAIGAVAGILLAPDKGANTRKKLMQKGNDYTSGLKDKFNSFSNSVSSKFDDAVNQAGEFSATRPHRK